MYALAVRAHALGAIALRRLVALRSERGQGTVEYVGLILLVALLMVGMVAAMKGFHRTASKARDPPEVLRVRRPDCPRF